MAASFSCIRQLRRGFRMDATCYSTVLVVQAAAAGAFANVWGKAGQRLALDNTPSDFQSSRLGSGILAMWLVRKSTDQTDQWTNQQARRDSVGFHGQLAGSLM
ncbi:hypothetical protein BCV70DRAFT_197177 [Testicularia cyperi]|uniref:Uncharacterized protein n=1 Tax=Testicularia cyperi TaxID=1882483 RepID=A0A317XXA8_9BASI|nr:hypothetical protein BCV70DRAFT_197177 [Testicularia cyperi]